MRHMPNAIFVNSRKATRSQLLAGQMDGTRCIRAAFESAKDSNVDVIVRLAPLVGERIEVRGLILLFENRVGS
jgi:hypothetical protein